MDQIIDKIKKEMAGSNDFFDLFAEYWTEAKKTKRFQTDRERIRFFFLSCGSTLTAKLAESLAKSGQERKEAFKEACSIALQVYGHLYS